MNRRSFLKLALVAPGAAFKPATQPTPNILFMLMDDLGWHDTGPYGNTFIDTPSLNRLAQESALFTNAYAACPVCSPTRASIMTGKYPARLHLTDWIPGRKQWPYAKLLTPAFEQHLPLEETTIAEAVHSRGYRSAAIGKWHLGGNGFLPTNQGFDINIAGTAAGSPPTYFGPLTLPGLQLEPGEFLTQRLTYEGSRFIKESNTTPFFLYEAQFTVHIPLQAPQPLIQKYRNRDTGDVDPTYCAMVETADTCVGQLLKSLEETGKSKNTIVVFFSDNGGVRYQARWPKPVTNNAPLRAGKGHLYEGGIREPLLIRWPGVTKPGSKIDVPVCSIDFLPAFCDALGVESPRADGISIKPLLQSGTIPERPLFWHYPHYSDQGGKPSGAVRLGDWKLIEFFEDNRLELFNLKDDLGERRNLVLIESERARKLHALLQDWRKSVNAAMPTPNPNYDPARASEGLTGYQALTPPVQKP
ncbi:MAG TPA: sulfatase [Bryobacteraceae bacterium]|jgi:arylsulfatase A-like enzyme|nr:sulfatase [Bryobacteraceae bacterium]